MSDYPYPSKEEREFDRRLLIELYESLSDSIDVPSALWAGATLILNRRRAVHAERLAAGADDAALRGSGEDPPPLPERHD